MERCMIEGWERGTSHRRERKEEIKEINKHELNRVPPLTALGDLTLIVNYAYLLLGFDTRRCMSSPIQIVVVQSLILLRVDLRPQVPLRSGVLTQG